jgi:hypothetical protein
VPSQDRWRLGALLAFAWCLAAWALGWRRHGGDVRQLDAALLPGDATPGLTGRPPAVEFQRLYASTPRKGRDGYSGTPRQQLRPDRFPAISPLPMLL